MRSLLVAMLITLLQLPFELPVFEEKPVTGSSCGYTSESTF